VDRWGGDLLAMGELSHSPPDEFAAAQFAVDGQVEQREFALAISQFGSNANGPDVLEFERDLLPYQLAFIPVFPAVGPNNG